MGGFFVRVVSVWGEASLGMIQTPTVDDIDLPDFSHYNNATAVSGVHRIRSLLGIPAMLLLHAA